MPSPEPQLDISAIDFPSDKWTLKEVRKRLMAISDPSERNTTAKTVGADWLVLVDSENRLAQMAFDEARGRKVVEEYADERVSTRDGLSISYADLGFASGEQHARQLVRDFEAAAANQASSNSKGRRR